MKILNDYKLFNDDDESKDDLLESAVRDHFSRADKGTIRRMNQQNIINVVEQITDKIIGHHDKLLFPDGIICEREKLSYKLEDKLNEIYL